MHWLTERDVPTEGPEEILAQARKLAAEIGVDIDEVFAQFRAGKVDCDPPWIELHGLWFALVELLPTQLHKERGGQAASPSSFARLRVCR